MGRVANARHEKSDGRQSHRPDSGCAPRPRVRFRQGPGSPGRPLDHRGVAPSWPGKPLDLHGATPGLTWPWSGPRASDSDPHPQRRSYTARRLPGSPRAVLTSRRATPGVTSRRTDEQPGDTRARPRACHRRGGKVARRSRMVEPARGRPRASPSRARAGAPPSPGIASRQPGGNRPDPEARLHLVRTTRYRARPSGRAGLTTSPPMASIAREQPDSSPGEGAPRPPLLR